MMENKNINFKILGKGYPFVFIHGLGGSHLDLIPFIGKIKNYKIILPDMRWHGLSQPTENLADLGFEKFSNDLGQMINEITDSKVIVGGISMGAGIALRFAISNPNWIKALILVRPAWLNKPLPQNLFWFKEIHNLLSKKDPESAYDLLRKNQDFIDFSISNPGEAKSLLGQITSENAVLFRDRLLFLPRSVPFNDLKELKRIKIPTLIVGSENDAIHPWKYAEVLNEEIPNSSLIKVKSKYIDPEEHTKAVSEKIAEFLDIIRKKNIH